MEFIKENKLKYVLVDTTIDSMKTVKSLLRVKNNKEFSSFLKRKFNIELFGNTNFIINLTGNLKNLNFKLDLNSNLTNSYLSINYLDIKKIKNIKSSIKSEISFIRGKIAFLENTHLKVGNNIYKIDLIEFNKQNINNIFLKTYKLQTLKSIKYHYGMIVKI